MSASDIRLLKGMPLTEGEPAFDEPWQAQAFAMVVALNENGALEWTDWAKALGQEIAANPAHSYWQCWLSSLQTILMRSGITSAAAIERRTEEWHEAARLTPHGEPITLDRSRIS